MRTTTITIGEAEYPLCFSVRVLRSCTERYGTFAGIYKALASENEVERLDEVLWVLEEMLRAGAKYARGNGQESPDPLSAEALLDQCDLADFVRFRGAITETITAGSKPRVETESKKKAAAARVSWPWSGLSGTE